MVITDSSLSRPVAHTGTKVRLLRDYTYPQFRKDGKPTRPLVFQGGSQAELFSNHQGGFRLVQDRVVMADDSYVGRGAYSEPVIREGKDFAFV